MKKLQLIYHIYSLADLNDSEVELIQAAKDSLSKSYSPYSHFQVAAALLMDDDTIVTGVNIENAAYSSCICAERTAITKARSENPKAQLKMLAIAVNGPNTFEKAGIAAPCGECRQVIFEWVQAYDYKVPILLYGNDEYIVKIEDVQALLPFGFGGAHLKS